MKSLKTMVLLVVLAGAAVLIGALVKRPVAVSPSVKSETPQTGANAAEQPIAVEGGSFYFSPNEIRATVGKPVTISYSSKNGLHDFVIAELNVGSDTVSGGQTTTVTFTPDKTGTFEFYCSIGRHREMGMKGQLIVQE